MKIKNISHTSLFAALTALGSLIIIPLPFSPVPITLQSLFVLLSGNFLGKKWGFMSQIIYIFIGVIGLPVFAGGTGGIGILFGPTSGFILSFPLASYISGIKINKYLAFTLATISIYIFGISGLILITKMGLSTAITSGVTPFLIGDIFKIFLAVYISERLNSIII